MKNSMKHKANKHVSMAEDMCFKSKIYIAQFQNYGGAIKILKQSKNDVIFSDQLKRHVFSWHIFQETSTMNNKVSQFGFKVTKKSKQNVHVTQSMHVEINNN